jgi:hypothetical protein
MLAALAGVVHERQSAADYEHSNRENYQRGGFHCDLATAWPQHYRPDFSSFKMNPT